jgi:hypothetical protein
MELPDVTLLPPALYSNGSMATTNRGRLWSYGRSKTCTWAAVGAPAVALDAFGSTVAHAATSAAAAKVATARNNLTEFLMDA